MEEYHIPVLLHESVDGLAIRPEGVYVDVTFGGGGHSREILARLGKKGCLVGFDQDDDAKQNIIDDSRFQFANHNFRFMRNFLKYYEHNQVHGILADLGVSSHHFDEAERGFSFRFDGKLDMRMNRQASQTAADVVNDYHVEDLYKIFRNYGEIKNTGTLVKTIEQARKTKKIETVNDFVESIKSLLPKNRENTYLAKVFQALRIEVNHEMDVLRDFLEQSVEVLAPGGRLSVITYHSLEDRLVKNFIKTGNFEGKEEKDFYGNVQAPLKAVNRKVIVPSDDEIARNNRARSAKLRIAEKV